MPVFPLLADPASYWPGLWDLRKDADVRAEWVRRLRANIGDVCTLVEETQGAAEARGARSAAAAWVSMLQALDHPAVHETHPTVHHLVTVRDRLLREHGVADAFAVVKERENGRCLDRLRSASRDGDLDPIATGDLFDVIEAGAWLVLAGNVFDMASPEVAAAYAEGGEGLARLAEEVRARAPAFDGRPDLRAWLKGRRLGHVLILVDNAGMDFLDGIVPLARTLAMRDCRVTLAANEHPALNDVTAAEAASLLGTRSERDRTLAAALEAGTIRVVSTGGASPGLDLREVSHALATVCADVDLVVVDGQGRAVETSWNAVLTVPVLRLATVKSPVVAARLGVEVFDPIFDFRLPGSSSGGTA